MDFFGLQDARQKQSATLIVFFAMAMIAMAVVVHIVAVLISMPVNSSVDFFTPSLPAKWFIGIIWLICLIGCFFRLLDVRAGGAALARRFGAIEANGAGRYREEQTLLDVVAEIAVASACDIPRTFILHREHSINAFVVGGFRAKEAIVISQGALEKLDRDQLSAVVAHEFGHIANGDIPLNMRLLIALGGLNAIDEVGKLLIGKNTDRLFAHPGIIVGYVVRSIGSIGTFSGRALRAAVSRQREYLADASAVQFTRMPEHLATTLAIVRDEHDDMGIHSVHNEELAHLCFQVGEITRWYQRVFATHPPIQKRIDAIDPHVATKQRARKRAEVEKKTPLYSVGNGTQVMPLSSDEPQIQELSDHAAMVLTDVSSCVAILHAIFVSPKPDKCKLYYHAIAFAYNKLFAAQVKDVREELDHEIRTNKMALVNKATSQIRDSIKLENRQRLLKSLEKLLIVEGEFTLMNYATLQLIRRQLNAEFPVLEQVIDTDVSQATGSQVKTFDTMGKEFALLLSLIVETSGNKSTTQDQQFQLALKCYTKEHHPRRSGDEAGIVKELEASFQTLYVQPRPIREAFVKHCLEIAQADGHIAKDERAMLDLFAASLKCDLQLAA